MAANRRADVGVYRLFVFGLSFYKEDEHAGQKADASQCKQGKRSCNDIGHIASARNKIALSLTLEHDQMNGLFRFEKTSNHRSYPREK